MKKNFIPKIFHETKKQLKLVFFGLMTIVFLLLGNSLTKAQTALVIPDDNQGSSFIGPYANAARTIQYLIDNTVLTSLNGKNLKSISFRLPASTGTAWPDSQVTYSNYSVYLSDSVEPANRQLDFAANVVGPQTQVRSGALVIPAGALTVGSNPNAFSFKINFDQNWVYNGTNLLIEIRHSGSGISSRTVQAVPTSGAGYGILFSALWQSTGSVLAGNFCYVEITAEDSLGTTSVAIDDELKIYPNPVKDILQIKTNRNFVTAEVYNLVGQLVLTAPLSADNSRIDVSKISNGDYLLKLKDEKGNVQVSKFIKN